MSKKFIFIILLFLFSNNTISATQLNITPPSQVENTTNITKDTVKLTDLKQQIRGDFRLFLEELYTERERGKKEAVIIITEMNQILNDTRSLIDDSRKEIKTMSYSESRNLLIASIFLWVSITIFIIMNLIFANNLKKELYFLRNGLLRSEIKDTMVNLSNQLTTLNEKLELMNREN